VITFSDHFRMTTLDTAKWSTFHHAWDVRHIPQIGHKHLWVERGHNGLQYDTHRVDRGVLRLTADISPSPRRTQGQKYISGMISTEQSCNQLYGTYSMRMRCPEGQGLWSAVWMVPSDGGDHIPEIDILEVLGHEPTTVYQYSTVDAQGTPPVILSGGQVHNWLIDASDDFHDYQLIWGRDTTTWKIDGATTQVVQTFAHEMHYLILSLSVGGDWPGDPDITTPFPSSLDIDYVIIEDTY